MNRYLIAAATAVPTAPITRPRRAGVMRLTAGVAALSAVLALTSVPAYADLGDLVVRMTGKNPVTIISINRDDTQLKMRMTGRAVFTPNDDDVQSLTGMISLQEKRGNVIRRIDFTNEEGGIKRVYRHNGNVKALDAEARQWVASVLQSLIVETGVDAESRVTRQFADGGATKVIDSIAKIRSGNARVRYIEALLKQTALDDKQFARVTGIIGGIDSDFEQRTAVSALVKRQTLTPTQQVAILGVVAAMDSDFEKRTALNALAPTLATEPPVLKAWSDALRKFDSDFEQRSAIEAMVARPRVTGAQIDAALAACSRIDSDFERATSLKAILRRIDAAAITTAQADAYLAAVRTMDGDFERRGALVALIERMKIERQNGLAVLKAIEPMDSDFEKKNALVSLAKRMPDDRELIDRYRTVAKSMNDFERGQAEKALDRMKP